MLRTTTKTSIISALVGLLVGFSMNAYSQYGNSTTSQYQSHQVHSIVSTTTPVRNIEKSTASEFILEYTFNGFTQNNKEQNLDTYQYLHIEGFSKMGEVGKPALPAHNDVILLPGGDNINIEIISSNYEILEGYNIHPTLQDASDAAGSAEPSFEKDQTTYQTNAFYPAEIVKVMEIQKIRGTNFGLLQIRPIQFNPVTGQLKVYTSIKYKISFSGSKANFNALERNTSTESLRQMRGSFINANILPKYNTAKSSNEYNYIILSTTAYQAAADTLAKWKRQMGYRVEVLTKSTWTSAEVKDSIHTRYHNWTVKPDFFVIIGDHDDVPAEIINYTSTKFYASDLYYACMDGAGDYIPEMAHGRISVSSTAQAMTTVLKMVNYERNPVVDPTFYSSATVASYFQDGTYYGSTNDGYADRRFIHTCEEVKDYANSQGITVDRVYTAYDNRTPTNYNNGYYSNGQSIPSDLLKANGFNWNGTGTDMNVSINNGRFFVVHRDHGYNEGVGYEHPQYVSAWGAVNALSNGSKLPVIFSINCSSGNFINDQTYNYTECIAESFIRKSSGGAVGVIAPSYTSYSGYNDAALIGMMDAIWSNPGIVPAFGAGGTSNPSLNSHDDIHTMGDIVNQGLLRMTQTWASTSRWKMQHEIYHYFGDPAMKIWTQSPTQISHNIGDTLERLSNSIQVTTNVSSGFVTLMLDNTIIASAEITNGTANLDIDYDSLGTAVLTITGTNYKPIQKNVHIDNRIIPSEPSVQASNINFASTSAKSSSLNVSWVNGDGDFRMVLINTSVEFTDPVDGTEYTADSHFNNNGQQVVYNGSDNEVTVSGLTEGTTYWFRVYEYNNKGVYTLYTTFEELNNPNNPDGGSLLPIELISFKGQQTPDGIELSWATASEYHNDYFTLERSEDGFEFTTVAIIQGAGSSNQILEYSQIDDQAPSGTVYYRLTQTDYNGTSTSSDIISVDNSSNNTLEITNIYHYDHSLNLTLHTPQAGNYICKVTDLNGRTIHNESLSLSEGSSKQSINTEALASGIYMCMIHNDSEHYSIKLQIP
jgi:hypothetical protein